METLQHKKTLELANAAVSRGDQEGFLSFCTQDTQWEFVGERVLSGKEAVRQYMAETYLEPPKFDVECMIAEGDRVTALGKISLKDAKGKMLDYSYCDVWTFSAGKLHKLKAFVVAMDQQDKPAQHAGDTVIGSGFSYDEARQPSDESQPGGEVSEEDIVDLPDLGQPGQP